jgi:5'-3' exonuclease
VILVIDGTNWIHSLWHTVRDRAPRLAAERLRAVCDYCADKMACEQVRRETFHPVVCWDRRSFRHDLHDGYKAGRAERDPGIDKALAEARKTLHVDAQQCEVEGYEADDLLASFAAAAMASGQKCVLCSADKDLYQCLRSGQVSILKNFKTERLTLDGVSHVRLYEPQWVTEAALLLAHGLRPDQWIDYQCLVGESGDNVPGCPGWGPKYAGELLKCWPSLAVVWPMLDRSSPNYNPQRLPGVKDLRKMPATYKSLWDWKPRYEWTRQLIELRTNVVEVWDSIR